MRIDACPLPAESMLGKYAAAGAYTDCYATLVTGQFSHAEFVEAFYTTFVFKLERLILRVFIARPSTDREAAELARGGRPGFAAWTVEERSADQLLLCDFLGRTRSWLMVTPEGSGTRLWFGSAVVPVRDPATGGLRMGRRISALMGFHKVYSRVLLWSAARRVSRKGGRS